MYSYEDRMRAVKLYINYDLHEAATIRELGYPNRKMIVQWYKEYIQTGQLHEWSKKKSKYSEQQRKIAVSYYLEHGCSIIGTIRAIGYSSRDTIRCWIGEASPSERKSRIKRSGVVQFSQEQKKEAVIELCSREGSATVVAEEVGVSRFSLYKWKMQLLGEEKAKTMSESAKTKLPDDRDALLADVESLKKKIYRQQMELDILNKAAEIIKNDRGIDPRRLVNTEKAILIDALRMKYPLNELLQMTDLVKSSYFYQRKAKKRSNIINLQAAPDSSRERKRQTTDTLTTTLNR